MSRKKFYYTVGIPSFIEKIQLSKSRRPKYYSKKDKIPKKYETDKYKFGKEGVLIDVDTGKKVVKNSRSVGTPNVKTITGQYFWVGAHPHIRRKIKREMSDFFYEHLQNIPTVKDEQYPLGVRIDLYDIVDGQDLDNFIFLYRKVIHDVLTGKESDYKGIITDDSKKYIQEINTRFYPIEDHEERCLVIEIYSL